MLREPVVPVAAGAGARRARQTRHFFRWDWSPSPAGLPAEVTHSDTVPAESTPSMAAVAVPSSEGECTATADAAPKARLARQVANKPGATGYPGSGSFSGGM